MFVFATLGGSADGLSTALFESLVFVLFDALRLVALGHFVAERPVPERGGGVFTTTEHSFAGVRVLESHGLRQGSGGAATEGKAQQGDESDAPCVTFPYSRLHATSRSVDGMGPSLAQVPLTPPLSRAAVTGRAQAVRGASYRLNQ